jgi:hypothetical protein
MTDYFGHNYHPPTYQEIPEHLHDNFVDGDGTEEWMEMCDELMVNDETN